MGQEQVTKLLEQSLESGKTSHAYLFIGPRGTGKTSVARIFAHAVNGFKYNLEDDYVDIIEIDGASNRGIDDIRELREKAAIAPTSGKYKVYIIDEVHMLTKEAFNALLKTLEEPPAHVIFIMATTDAYKVPVTITSRAQTYTFKLAEPSIMLAHLKSIAKQEKIKITDAALNIIVKRGGGSFRDSLSLLDQISTLSDKEITEDLVINALGLPASDKIEQLLNYFVQGEVSQITAELKDLLSSGVRAETLTEEIINTIIAKPAPEYLPLLRALPEVKEPFAEAKLVVALCGNVSILPNSTLTITTTATKTPTAKSSVTTTSGATATNVTASTKTTKIKTTTTEITTTATTGAGDSKIAYNVDISSDANSTAISNTANTLAFNWTDYLAKIQKLNEVIYIQLTKSEYEVDGDTLKIYPRTQIIKNILEKTNNKQILVNNAQNVKITICEAGKHPNSRQNDETINKISAIMGGEVMNDEGGNSPF